MPASSQKAYRIYLIYSALCDAFYALTFTVNTVYYVQTAHLDPLQLVLVGTALETSVFVFEIPTGVVADVYSRRLSIIIGMFLTAAGFVLQGAWPSFLPIILAQVLWGIGYTFTSGATQAWISDEIGEAQAGAAFLRANQFSQFGFLAGTGVSVVLGAVALNLPMITSGVLFACLGIFLIIAMPEDGFTPTPAEDRTSWQRMAATLRDGLKVVRRRPALGGILAVGLVYGLYSEGFDRLWTAYLLEHFTFPALGNLPQIVWFGLISAVSALLSIAASEVVRRRVETSRSRSIALVMAGTTAALVAALAGFACSAVFGVALALYWVISALRQINYPLYTAWVNQRLDPQVRATVISMSSQVDAFGQIAGGPGVGLVARRVSLRAGLLTSALLLSPALGLIAGILRGSRSEVSESGDQ